MTENTQKQDDEKLITITRGEARDLGLACYNLVGELKTIKNVTPTDGSYERYDQAISVLEEIAKERETGGILCDVTGLNKPRPIEIEAPRRWIAPLLSVPDLFAMYMQGVTEPAIRENDPRRIVERGIENLDPEKDKDEQIRQIKFRALVVNAANNAMPGWETQRQEAYHTAREQVEKDLERVQTICNRAKNRKPHVAKIHAVQFFLFKECMFGLTSCYRDAARYGDNASEEAKLREEEVKTYREEIQELAVPIEHDKDTGDLAEKGKERLTRTLKRSQELFKELETELANDDDSTLPLYLDGSRAMLHELQKLANKYGAPEQTRERGS